jgi:hypothetical protein
MCGSGRAGYGCRVDERGEPLGDLVQHYIAAVSAVSEAAKDASSLGDEPMTTAMALEYVTALRRMIDTEREALAVFDRFVARAELYGVACQDLADLREARAGLVLGLQDAVRATGRVGDAHLGSHATALDDDR